MFLDIVIITLLCIALGGASIPLSFSVNDNPLIVWAGNSLGSIISALVVIYIGNRITNDAFKEKANKFRLGRKVTSTFDKVGENTKAQKTGVFINKHGLRMFGLLCPIFPGVLVSTAIVFALQLDKTRYIRWMLAGVFFVSGAYVCGYWWTFVKP